MEPKIELNLGNVKAYSLELDYLCKEPTPMYPEWRIVLKGIGDLIVDGEVFNLDYAEIYCIMKFKDNEELPEFLFPEMFKDE